jgi:hypothetical protein
MLHRVDVHRGHLMEQHSLDRVGRFPRHRRLEGRFKGLRFQRELHPTLGGFHRDRVRILQGYADVRVQRHALGTAVEHAGLTNGTQESPGVTDGREEGLSFGVCARGIRALQDARMDVEVLIG